MKSAEPKKLLQLIKPILSGGGRAVEVRSSTSFNRRYRSVIVVVPTSKLNQSISKLQSLADKNQWFLTEIGWYDNKVASKLLKVSDTEFDNEIEDILVFGKGGISVFPYKKGMTTSSKSGFKSAKYSFVRLDPSYPSDPYDKSRLKTLYHITTKSNFDKIMSQGLQPKVRTDRTYPPRVYLFDTKEATKQLIPLLHRGKKEGDVLVIQMSAKSLKQAVPDIDFWLDPEPSAGYFTDKAIPPSAFTKVYVSGDKGLVHKFDVVNGKLKKV